MASFEIRRSLAVLERLKQAVATYTAREEELARKLDRRRMEISWRFQAAVGGEEESTSVKVNEVGLKFGDEEARVRRVARQRETHVRRASAQLLRTMPQRAREARGNWLAKLQMRQLRAESERSTALQEAEAEAGRIAATLTELCRRLIAVKRETRRRFTGYWQFRGRLREKGMEECAPGEEGVRLITAALEDAEGRLAAFGQFLAPKIFQYLPPPVIAVIWLAAGAGLAALWHFQTMGWALGGTLAAVLLAATFGIQVATKRQVERSALELVQAVLKADALYEAARLRAENALEEKRREIQAHHDSTQADIADQWGRVDDIERDFQVRNRSKIEAQSPRLLARIHEQELQRAADIARERQGRLAKIRDHSAWLREEAERNHSTDTAQYLKDESAEWQKLETDWKTEILPIYAEIRDIQAEGRQRSPDWAEEWIERWKPPADFPADAKFASFKVSVKDLAGGLPKDPRLSLPGPAEFSLPLALAFPQRGSLLIEAQEAGRLEATGTLNALVLRLMAVSPPGKVSFTIIDPVGLGQNFAGLMFLADYEETLINRRIWTQQSQIEERLAELNEHIEKVIQMYLRNEYETISEYNEKAGSIAEKYHFLVVADFPSQFSETAARRLQSIAASGPRCGVFTLIQWDPRMTPAEGLATEELRRNSVCVQRKHNTFSLPGMQPDTGVVLALETPPEADLAAKLVRVVGQASVDSNRVEVPFAQIAPGAAERWSEDTTQELKVAIGRTGATKPQYLAIGKGTRQHALVAGKTGSGKSTLFHVIVTNLALWCSPREVEFYLIDFKKGVEFKCYAEKKLPHARVVAIESDREFALSVLRRVDEELRRRGDLFRTLGVQDLPGYKRAGGTGEIPRTLLLIDEFQEFFVEDDAIAQEASLLFDRIVRQGRAFGIHALLGSQTLGGAYTLARATLGQMVIRIALQCNEADAYLIMDDNNAAPRLLSRPGEGIYNDAAGALEGNSPFQVVWLPDDERDRLLDEVHALAEERGMAGEGPIVFEGNAPADVRDNALLRGVLETPPAAVPQVARIWLGAPNSIKGPTEADFHRQSGSNLLIVGQREEAALSMLGLSLLALGAQYPAGGARFVFFQGATDGPGPAFIEAVAKTLPHEVSIVTHHETAEAMNGIAAELKQRIAGGAYGAGPVFVIINALHKFKKLRHEEDFSFSAGGDDGDAGPGAQFDELIREGSAYGVHLLATIDAYSNVARFISRKGIAEFEMRVVFQMSANDSATLIDSPRASTLGLHRALLFNEREGTIETFRPYALPGKAWLEETAAALKARRQERAKQPL